MLPSYSFSAARSEECRMAVFQCGFMHFCRIHQNVIDEIPTHLITGFILKVGKEYICSKNSIKNNMYDK